MKLGIDISQIVYEGSGVSRFTQGLVSSILEHDTKNRWVFFFSSLRLQLNPKLKKEILEKGHVIQSYKLPPTALSFIWNQIHRFKVEKLTGQLDWFITSDWTEPPSKMKKATIIHDLVCKKYPETLPPVIKTNQDRRLNWIKKESRVIFADSLSTKHDLMEFFHIEDQKIVVNYPGVTIHNPNSKTILEVLKKYHLYKPFILTVGKIEPRKNIKRLIDAFNQLNQTRIDLVVVGHQGWDTEISKVKNDNKHIRFLQYISDNDLPALYKSCLFFVYPSLYEGFGFPVAEAFRLKTPVATSNSSSLSEIGKDCSLLFDPTDTQDIRDKLSDMLKNEKNRERIALKGYEKSKQFIWKAYFDTMMHTFEEHR